MKRIRAWMDPRRSIWMMMGLLLLFMLLLNCLTPYIADDYVYQFGFHSHMRNESAMDVIRSMYAHCFTMNGRVISHGLEALFLLLPKLVFNLCNSAVYVVLMYALYRICRFGKPDSPLLFLEIAMAFWCFMPVFGQVVLWQVGALNYLWGLAVGIAFLLPYIIRYVNKKEPLPRLWMKVLFSACALLMGMYTEVTSFVAIVLGILLLVCAGIADRNQWKTWLWIPLAIACVGFLLMMCMPAEINAKHSGGGLTQLLQGIDTAVWMLEKELKWLCVGWAVCFGLGIYKKCARKRLVLSGLFAFGAVLGNFMLSVAAYYPERCMCTSCMLLILACGILMPELKTGSAGAFRTCVFSGLCVVFLFALARGSYDIWRTHTGFTAREQVIEAAKQKGAEDLTLQIVHANTKYSAYWDTKDLDTETADTWPNRQMAEYYGVRSIIGY